MPEQPAPKDFFISYNKADKAWAEWIAWQLEEEGQYQVILQAWDFLAGDNFVVGMVNAAEQAHGTIAVLSPDYLTALFTKPEWAAAFVQDPTGEKGLLMPVRVRECELPNLLKPIIYIDLVGLEVEEARERLLAEVTRQRRKPATEPLFPGQAVPPESRAVTREVRFPGSLPPIWNLPQRRNPNFTGREEMLEALKEALASGQPAALCGLGGKGKTALAVEYVYRNHPYYDLVWWLRSEEAAVLSADYAALAGPLGLPEKDAPDLEAQVKAVRQCLGWSDKWLLIFDNASGPEAIKDYLPQGGGGQVLITSRNPAWRGLARPLEVKVLPPERSVEFLLKRTGQSDEASAKPLAEALGNLPLALEQAGAYMEETGTSFAGYLHLFLKRRRDLWGEEKPPDDYPATVATTWSVALDKIKEEATGAAELLNLFAFLAPDDIPLLLLVNICEEEKSDFSLLAAIQEIMKSDLSYEELSLVTDALNALNIQTGLPEGLEALFSDPLALNSVLAALKRYSFIERGEDSLSVHRLVQAVVRDRLGDEENHSWLEVAISLVHDVFPQDILTNLDSWPICARLLPHALAALERAGELNLLVSKAGSLWSQVGTYLFNRAEFGQAQACFERALRIDEVVYGPDHPYSGTCVNNLGSVLQSKGDLSGARAHYERALKIDEAAYGQDDPRVARDVNNLGAVLWEQGDLSGARIYFERALRIDEAAYGSDHPEVARDVNNLGNVLRALDDLAGALECHKRALQIDEAAYGPDHPEVARDINNLGQVLWYMGDMTGSGECYARALVILEKALGTDHPKVAVCVNNLGSVLKDQGDLAGAKECFERALGIKEAAYGPDHPEVATSINNLGSVLQAQGDLAGAKACCERALDILTKFLGPDHPNTQIARENLESLGK